jgi:hypothetical protein
MQKLNFSTEPTLVTDAPLIVFALEGASPESPEPSKMNPAVLVLKRNPMDLD